MSAHLPEAQYVTESSWQRRRRMMFSVVGFCMGCIAFVLYQGTDTEVARTTITMSFTTLISVTGTYVFGATWDDKR
jgi:hypothetical protein